jgi:hypothetical protein
MEGAIIRVGQGGVSKRGSWGFGFRCLESDKRNFLCFADRASQYNLSNWPT